MKKKSLIAVGSQYVDEDDVAYVSGMLKDDFLTQGPQVARFEESLANFIGAKFVSAVASGSAALHIACKVLQCDQQTTVFTPPITFAASQNAALHLGGKIQFVDVNPHSGNICVQALAEALDSNPSPKKIIMPVHFAGLACDLDEIHILAKQHNAKVIEDASHALGAQYKGKFIGATHPEHLVTLSFHPLKHITTGEGGAIACGQKQMHSASQLYRSHGIDKSVQTVADQKGKLWHYEMSALGFNYRMSEINAALGVSQMQKLEAFLNKRQHLAKRYTEKLTGLNCILPSEENNKTHAWLLYMLQVDFKALGMDKNELMLKLREKGVATQVHNIPVYRHPYFVAQYGDLRAQFPKSEQFFAQTFSIPLHPGLSEDDQDQVIDALTVLLG